MQADKRPFTPHEDDLIASSFTTTTTTKPSWAAWTRQHLPHRTPGQVRDRYYNYLQRRRRNDKDVVHPTTNIHNVTDKTLPKYEWTEDDLHRLATIVSQYHRHHSSSTTTKTTTTTSSLSEHCRPIRRQITMIPWQQIASQHFPQFSAKQVKSKFYNWKTSMARSIQRQLKKEVNRLVQHHD